MANDEKQFIRFMGGMRDPKLTWVMEQFVLLGVAHKLGLPGFLGPTLLIDPEHLLTALSVLDKEVGLVEGGAWFDGTITVRDLPDDHPLFSGDNTIEELPLEAEVVPADIPLTEAITIHPKPPKAVIPYGDVIKVPEIPDIDPLGEIADAYDQSATEVEGNPVPDEEEDPFAPDPPATVEVDPFAEDDDDDALWDTTEPAPETPELDYLRADKALANSEVQFDGVKGTVKMYETNSVNISAIGARINQTDQTKCTLYAQFKGGPVPYRYGAVLTSRFHDLLGEAVRKAEGRQDVSVGSMFHHLIKVDADEGKILCQRLAEHRWVEVLPKSQRIKKVKDAKKKE